MAGAASKTAIEDLLTEQVGRKLSFNLDAYGAAWTGEGADINFIVSGAVEAVLSLLNDERARMYSGVVDGLHELADDLSSESVDMDHLGGATGHLHSFEAATVREIIEPLLARLEVEKPRCHECGAELGGDHGPGCATGDSNAVGNSVVTRLVNTDDCLARTPMKEPAA